MNKMKFTSKKDYFNNEVPQYKDINEGTDLLFSDVMDILEGQKIPEEKLELIREQLANSLYYHYHVVFTPLNTDASLQ